MYVSMLKGLFISFTVLITVFLALVSSSIAAPITFTNQANYLAAIGGSADISEDFNSYTSDASFQNGTVDVGPFSLSSSGPFHNKLNIIDVKDFSFPDGTIDPNDSPYAGIFTETTATGSTSMTWTFDDPIDAFGAVFREVDPTTLISFATSAGSGSIMTGIMNGFFGFVLDPGQSITSFTFTTPVKDGFGVDDVLLSSFEGGAVNISEPNVFPLILGALFGMLWFTRRKQA